MAKVQFYADVDTIQNKRGTRELKVILFTQELSDDSAGILLSMRDKYVSILLSTSEVKQEEADEISEEFTIAPLLEGKTPSQRLRNVLYVQWESRYKTRYPEFDSFYNQRMEQIIEDEKERI